jgi:hypothetical protein
MSNDDGRIGRRSLVRNSAGIVGGALLAREATAEEPVQQNVNTNSSPSALKITDLRVAVVMKPGLSPCQSFASIRIRAYTVWARLATAQATRQG